MLLLIGAGAAIADESTWRPTRLRVRLQAPPGEASLWIGDLSLSEGRFERLTPLNRDPLAAASVGLRGGRMELNHRTPRPGDAMDVTVNAPPGAKVIWRHKYDDRRVETASIPVDLARESPHVTAVDDGRLRLRLDRYASDHLRIETPRSSLLFEPSETFDFTVIADLPAANRPEVVDLQATLSVGRNGEEVWRSQPTRIDSSALQATPVIFETPLPSEPGVYRLEVTATRPAGFRARFLPNGKPEPIARRTVQVAVVAPTESASESGNWSVVESLALGGDDRSTSGEWIPWRRTDATTASLSSETSDAATDQIGPADPTGAAHWRAIPLVIEEPGALYAIELAPEGLADSKLALGVLETDALGALRPLGPAVVLSPPRWNRDASREPGRLVFRPRTESPVLVVANPSRSEAASLGEVRLLKSEGRLATPPAGRRVVALDWASPDLPHAVGASHRAAASGGYEVPDLQTWWETARGLADRVEAAGAGAAVIPLNQNGSSIFDSRYASGPRFDLATWEDPVDDAPRRELLRLILSEFGRRGLSVYLAVRFDAPITLVEQAAEQALPFPYGEDPERLREARQAVISEARRVAEPYESFAGIALRASRIGWSTPRAEAIDPALVGLEGIDFVLPAEFASRIEVAASLAPRLGASPVLSSETLARVGLLGLTGAGLPVAKVYGAARPADAATSDALAVALDALRRATHPEPAMAPVQFHGGFRGLKLAASAGPLGGDGLHDLVLPTVFDDPALEAGGLAAAAVEGSSLAILSGHAAAGWVDPEARLRRREFAALPTPLPSDPSADDAASSDVVVLRQTDNEGTAILVVNRSSWPASANLTLDVGTPTRGRRIAEDDAAAADEWFQPGRHALALQMAPHQAVAWRFDGDAVVPDGVRRETNEAALEELGAAVEALRECDTTQPRACETLPNRGFEADEGDEAVTGWSLSEGVTVSRDTPHEGAAALRFSASVDVDVDASAASDPFARPLTGQLLLGLWVRPERVTPDTELRIDVESPEGGYRRGTSLVAEQLAVASDADPNAWREVIFPMADLPLGADGTLQIRLTLSGDGEVSVDGLWAEDLLLPRDGYGAYDLRQEKLALVTLFSAAADTLAEGRLEACRELLDGYWARFVVENFPRRAAPLEPPAEDVIDEEPAPIDDVAETPAGEEGEESPTIGQRLRGYLPTRWWR